MFSFLQKSYPEIDYSDLIDKLEKNNSKDLSLLLFESNKINYLPLTFEMLKKMKKPPEFTNGLTLHQKHSNGKYELAIFNIPWSQSAEKFLPLLLDKKVGKIAGIMLPFNEILPLLTKSEQRKIHELTMIWTDFIISKQFGV